jgi:disulfide bond formation protein DsbB
MTLEPTLRAPDQHEAGAVFAEHAGNMLVLQLVSYQRSWFPRVVNILGFVICTLMLSFAYYLQYHEGLMPCPLCIVQRLIVATLGLVFLTAALHNPSQQGYRRYGAVIFLVAVLGAGVAGYHVWLQMSESAGFCLLPINHLLATFSLPKIISLVLENPAGCGAIQWTLLGLSIPVWTLLAFIGLGVVGAIRSRS